MEEKYQVIVENFCKSALKKGFIDIIKLSYVLGCDSQYTVVDIVDWWKKLHMNTRLADTPDLSTPEKTERGSDRRSKKGFQQIC